MEKEECNPKIIKDEKREKIFTVIDSRGNDLGVRVEAHLVDSHYVMAYTGIHEPLRHVKGNEYTSPFGRIGGYTIFAVRNEGEEIQVRRELEDKLKEIFVKYVEQHNKAVEGRLAHPGIVG